MFQPAIHFFKQNINMHTTTNQISLFSIMNLEFSHNLSQNIIDEFFLRNLVILVGIELQHYPLYLPLLLLIVTTAYQIFQFAHLQKSSSILNKNATYLIEIIEGCFQMGSTQTTIWSSNSYNELRIVNFSRSIRINFAHYLVNVFLRNGSMHICVCFNQFVTFQHSAIVLIEFLKFLS